MTQSYEPAVAPPLCVSQWFNTDHAITLDELRGKVVLIYTLQMLCAGCGMYATPQAVRLWQDCRQGPRREDVAVIGLHTVSEHHHVMTPATLLIDGAGRLRKNHFGIETEQQAIADIDRLVAELDG